MNHRAQMNGMALILMYHRIAEANTDPWSLCVTPHHFDEQLETLRKFCRMIQLRELTEMLLTGSLSDKFIVVTFDDGYADNFHNAKPLLEKNDVPATIFVVTGSLGCDSEFWSDELERIVLQPGRLPSSFSLSINDETITRDLTNTADYSQEQFDRYRNWKAFEDDPPSERQSFYLQLWKALRPLPVDLRQIKMREIRFWAGHNDIARASHRTLMVEELTSLSGGLVEVGSHTETHPYLSSLSQIDQQTEITASKQRLEEIIQSPITSFAYPYGGAGDYNEDSIRFVKEAGYTGACSTVRGSVCPESDPYQLPRLHVGNWDGEEFAKRLSVWFNGGE